MGTIFTQAYFQIGDLITRAAQNCLQNGISQYRRWIER